MAKRRANPPEATATKILVANRHTCCICNFWRKKVVLHHINGVPDDNDPENLAVLCLDCHGWVESDEGLGRSITPNAVRLYKKEWEELWSLDRREARIMADAEALFVAMSPGMTDDGMATFVEHHLSSATDPDDLMGRVALYCLLRLRSRNPKGGNKP